MTEIHAVLLYGTSGENSTLFCYNNFCTSVTSDMNALKEIIIHISKSVLLFDVDKNRIFQFTVKNYNVLFGFICSRSTIIATIIKIRVNNDFSPLLQEIRKQIDPMIHLYSDSTSFDDKNKIITKIMKEQKNIVNQCTLSNKCHFRKITEDGISHTIPVWDKMLKYYWKDYY